MAPLSSQQVQIEDLRPLARQGYTSTVLTIPGEPTKVVKVFNHERSDKLFAAERAAYERFAANNPPSSLLTYYGIHETIPKAIVLEFAENHDLYEYLWLHSHGKQGSTDKRLLYRWAIQAAGALEFAHAVGVFNSDIHCINFFLDGNLNLKVGDWAGSSIDGSISQSSYRLQYRLILNDGTDVASTTGISVLTEIFALGTAIWYMVTTHDPWPEVGKSENREEIKNRIQQKHFPDTARLQILGAIIRKCWHSEFATMKEVKHAIIAEADVGIGELPQKALEDTIVDDSHDS